MLHRFKYDDIEIDGKSYYIRGEAEIDWEDGTASSEMGERWVHQQLCSHVVKDVWIEWVEDLETEQSISVTDSIMEYIQSRLEEKQFDFTPVEF